VFNTNESPAVFLKEKDKEQNPLRAEKEKEKHLLPIM
jgi:hypothetical protein